LTAAAHGTIDYVTSEKIRKLLPGNEWLDPYDFAILAEVVSSVYVLFGILICST
jgi:hypothetical protein